MFATNLELVHLGKLYRLAPKLGHIWVWLFQTLRRFHLTATPANLWLVEHIEKLVHTRLEGMAGEDGHNRHVDLLQLMVDAADGDKVSEHEFRCVQHSCHCSCEVKRCTYTLPV